MRSFVMLMKKADEVQEVGCIESAMPKGKQALEIFIGMIKTKLVGRVVHQRQQFPRLIDNHDAIAPGENGCKKSSDLYVLPCAKHMRNAHRIICYECRAIVFENLLIKK